jgi:hypothetical protein
MEDRGIQNSNAKGTAKRYPSVIPDIVRRLTIPG